MENHNIVNPQHMKVREFFIRIGLFLPMAVFGLLFLLLLLGIGADLLGAKSAFYCTIYCKICAAILVLGATAVVYCQAKACWKR